MREKSSVIENVVNLGENRIKYVHLFILDGCNASSFYQAICNSSKFHKLWSLMSKGHFYFDNCYTVFPSVTIPCHASILTGTYPGMHGITGNNWFYPKMIKDPKLPNTVNGYVKFGTKSNPGLIQNFGKANLDLNPEVKTIFEAYKDSNPSAKCASIFEFITRGLSKEETIRPSLKMVSAELLRTASYYLYAKVFPSEDSTAKLSLHLDQKAMQLTIETLLQYNPELSVTWLPGMDGFSHFMGAHSQNKYMEKFSRIDRQIGQLIDVLKKQGRLDETLVIFTADHGQYDCSEDTDKLSFRITRSDIYSQLSNNQLIHENYRKSLPIKQKSKQNLDNDCLNYSMVAADNGGMCHIYVKELQTDGEGHWGHPRRFDNDSYNLVLNSICKVFKCYRGIDQIFMKTSLNDYLQWDKSRDRPTKFKATDTYHPLSDICIDTLACSKRSGDIILTALDGYYFSDSYYKGEHGTLSPSDTNVPLLMISPCLPSSPNHSINVLGDIISTTMITPTVAKIMNFHDQLVGSHKFDAYERIVEEEHAFATEEYNYLLSEYSNHPDLSDNHLETIGIFEVEEFVEPFLQELKATIEDLENLVQKK